MAYAIAVTWEAKAGEEARIAQILAELEAASNAEAGVRVFTAHRDLDAPAVFFLYELYDDKAAHQAHMQTPHFKSLVIEQALPRLVRRERLFLAPLADGVGGAAA